jgi:type I restriction enzyme S subunit
MNEFSELKVGDHISLLSGFPFSSDYFDQHEGTRLIRIRDLLESDGDKTYFRGFYDSRWLVKPRDILIGMDGDFNIVRWQGDEALLNQRILKVEAKPNGLIDQDYFFYWCGPYLTWVHNRTAATTVKHLSTKDIDRAKALFPPKKKQAKIAEILATVDEAIEQTEALVQKWQLMKAGLMHDLFTRGVTAAGQLRPTRQAAPQLYKQSPLGWIPKEWDVKTVNDVIDIERGFAFQSTDYRTSGILNFRVSNVGHPFDDLGGTEFLPPEFWEVFPNQQLFGGEILIVMVGATTGKLGRVPEEICPALLNQNLWHLKPKGGFDREFAWCLMPSIVSRHMRLSQGSARDFLKQSDFGKTLTVVPNPDEQIIISARVHSISDNLERERSLANKLRAQMQGLMQDLLTGRVPFGNLTT